MKRNLNARCTPDVYTSSSMELDMHTGRNSITRCNRCHSNILLFHCNTPYRWSSPWADSSCDCRALGVVQLRLSPGFFMPHPSLLRYTQGRGQRKTNCLQVRNRYEFLTNDRSEHQGDCRHYFAMSCKVRNGHMQSIWQP